MINENRQCMYVWWLERILSMLSYINSSSDNKYDVWWSSFFFSRLYVCWVRKKEKKEWENRANLSITQFVLEYGQSKGLKRENMNESNRIPITYVHFVSLLFRIVEKKTRKNRYLITFNWLIRTNKIFENAFSPTFLTSIIE